VHSLEQILICAAIRLYCWWVLKPQAETYFVHHCKCCFLSSARHTISLNRLYTYVSRCDSGRAVPTWSSALVPCGVSGLDFSVCLAHRAVPCWHDKSSCCSGPSMVLHILAVSLRPRRYKKRRLLRTHHAYALLYYQREQNSN